MDDKRLDEIRTDWAAGADLDPEWVTELLNAVSEQAARIAELEGEVEHYKLQSDQLCDRVEVLVTENAALKEEGKG